MIGRVRGLVGGLEVALLGLLIGGGLVGCKRSEAPASRSAAHTAEPIGPNECAVCGMVVREQPAPRGQVVHRDGERAHFCSLGDMVQYQRVPSPHGKVQAAFVEVLDASVDPRAVDPAPRPWRDAEQTTFVVGVGREGPIMGAPVLSYARREDAERIAREHDGTVRDWDGLQQLTAQPKPTGAGHSQPAHNR